LGFLEVVLNGQPRAIAEGQTLLDLVCSLDLEPARVAAELDGRIVKRDRWAETPLHTGARLELVHFVGGG
jgi:thiamine biosynthesis protein ThiS